MASPCVCSSENMHEPRAGCHERKGIVRLFKRELGICNQNGAISLQTAMLSVWRNGHRSDRCCLYGVTSRAGLSPHRDADLDAAKRRSGIFHGVRSLARERPCNDGRHKAEGRLRPARLSNDAEVKQRVHAPELYLWTNSYALEPSDGEASRWSSVEDGRRSLHQAFCTEVTVQLSLSACGPQTPAGAPARTQRCRTMPARNSEVAMKNIQVKAGPGAKEVG